MNPLVWIIVGLILAVGVWQLVVWLVEMKDKDRKYKVAASCAARTGKPLLVAGGPWGSRPLRRFFRMPAHGLGDICFDISRNAITGHPNAAIADVTCIPFSDKVFGAAYASHLLEHLPSAEAAKKALDELCRVAEAVYIAYPSRQSIGGWLTPGHRLWVWEEGSAVCIRQKDQTGVEHHVELVR